MTNNARLEDVPTFFEVVRISNHALKGKVVVNYSNQVR